LILQEAVVFFLTSLYRTDGLVPNPIPLDQFVAYSVPMSTNAVKVLVDGAPETLSIVEENRLRLPWKQKFIFNHLFLSLFP
jgi:hypothetical protein